MEGVRIGACHAWGYLQTEKYHDTPASVIYFHNVLNVGSLVLSPLIGVVRLIAALFVHCILKPGLLRDHDFNNGSMPNRDEIIEDREGVKRFFKMQMGRGVMEIFCLGPILGIAVDPVMTLKHREMLCFAKA